VVWLATARNANLDDHSRRADHRVCRECSVCGSDAHGGAFLIRQDSSDCTNSNVNANDPSRIGGTVWVVRGPDGNTSVKVGITATPNTVYHFFLKCVRALGDIKTEDEGEATASFEFPTNSVGSVFAFDMYPEGAPAGNKYQSIQVKIP
jgi:hypothetical protein